ncbi:similar to Saccharomyces cerevisiae YLR426W TDA5 Putative protein of unknown function [Maudiozyma barnettii]|uniref:Uncharacterized protein n=1 Tax=Maudiozyma barnettii TaxID=61262 RepID=A0A8H2VJL4_9SACH|nr:Tda5p [Kazachstania barnettii]CAB4256530.1 similar to Saccharomyces cerevisiae YLR426W TDA5 Putative protein of unknown function [Kazachstania barnettii]CAD1785133.1 similar to Saccharomyces cerevisiae YLR426W TDA5 Putative protein of unknown function [Kazachstania barnettii]
MISIDTIFYCVILPCLKYPCLLILPCQWIPVWIKVASVIYSITFYLFNAFNKIYKFKCTKEWKNLRDITGNVVVISGGSGGLGYSLIKTLLERFPSVTIINIDKIPSTIKDERLMYYRCDLSNSLDVQETVQTIKEQFENRINLIVNNAGTRLAFKPINKLNEDEIKRIFQVNCFAAIEVIKQLTPNENDERQCFVVTIASVLGILNPCKVAAYAASKAALISFHQSYEQELRVHHVDNIRTLLVIPGQLNTKMFGGFEPPRQFWAPTIDVESLAKYITYKCEIGERGTIQQPLYANFAHILMSMPYVIQVWVRKFAQIDDCLPDE